MRFCCPRGDPIAIQLGYSAERAMQHLTASHRPLKQKQQYNSRACREPQGCRSQAVICINHYTGAVLIPTADSFPQAIKNRQNYSESIVVWTHSCISNHGREWCYAEVRL